MNTGNNFLFQETLRTQEYKVLDCNKRKDWRKKKNSLFVVDSCSGSLATLATATALPVPPAILIISYCSIALNFGYDFVLLVHFFGTPSRVYPPHLLLNQNCLPLFHLQICMCSTLRLKKPFSNSSAKTFCRKPSRVDKRANFFHQASDSNQALKDVIQADGSTTRFFHALGH